MASGHSDRVYEILTLIARPGQLDAVLQNLHDFVSKTEEAAAAAGMEPALDHFFYRVRGSSDEAVILVPWRSQSHHDDLSKDPSFEPAVRHFMEQVVANLSGPPEPSYVPLPGGQVRAIGSGSDRFDVPAIDRKCHRRVFALYNSLPQLISNFPVIEISLAEEADTASLPQALESTLLGKERQHSSFLGWFYGYKDQREKELVIGLRWGSQQGGAEKDSHQEGLYAELTEVVKEVGKVSRRRNLLRTD